MSMTLDYDVHSVTLPTPNYPFAKSFDLPHVEAIGLSATRHSYKKAAAERILYSFSFNRVTLAKLAELVTFYEQTDGAYRTIVFTDHDSATDNVRFIKDSVQYRADGPGTVFLSFSMESV